MSELREKFEGMSTAQLKAVAESAEYRAEAQQLAHEILASRSSSPPTQPCAVHPAMQVSGTCSRCGTFICLDCDPSFSRDGQGTCAACQARVEHAPVRRSPVSLVTGCNGLMTIQHGAFAGWEMFGPHAQTPAAVPIAMHALLCVMSAIATVRVFNREPDAIRWTTTACGAAVANVVVMSALVPASSLFGRVGCLLILQVIGAIYLHSSPAARAEFRPPAPSAPV